MATNCLSDEPRPRSDADEALAWVTAAWRSEQMLAALHDRPRPVEGSTSA